MDSGPPFRSSLFPHTTAVCGCVVLPRQWLLHPSPLGCDGLMAIEMQCSVKTCRENFTTKNRLVLPHDNRN
eukprot:86413-Rhodomonas_salina.4